MAYRDVSDHSLLSPEANALSGTSTSDFEDVVEAAELMLGLDRSYAEAMQQSMAKLAVVHQVNHLVEHADVPASLTSKSQSDRSWSFSESTPAIHPTAKEMAGYLERSGSEKGKDAYEVVRHL